MTLPVKTDIEKGIKHDKRVRCKGLRTLKNQFPRYRKIPRTLCSRVFIKFYLYKFCLSIIDGGGLGSTKRRSHWVEMFTVMVFRLV